MQQHPIFIYPLQLLPVPWLSASVQPGDVSRYFTMVGIAASFISTFFAHGFLTLARQAIWQVSE